MPFATPASFAAFVLLAAAPPAATPQGPQVFGTSADLVVIDLVAIDAN